MRLAKERWRCNAMSSLIDWVHAQNDPCIPLTKASDVELWFCLLFHVNKRLNKQSSCWWFVMLQHSHIQVMLMQWEFSYKPTKVFITHCMRPKLKQLTPVPLIQLLGLMTSSNENIFRITGHLCGEFTSHGLIRCTKASDTELWCFLCSAPEQMVE